MTSPIQRIPQTDKTLMPLRGEGNQPPKQLYIDCTDDSDEMLQLIAINECEDNVFDQRFYD